MSYEPLAPPPARRRPAHLFLAACGLSAVLFLWQLHPSTPSLALPSAFRSSDLAGIVVQDEAGITSDSSSSAVDLSHPFTLPPTLVGPRPRFAPSGRSQYTSCSVDELLSALTTAKIRPDGASMFPNFTQPESVDLRPLEWSFDL
ncbi:hypothetical protein JCM10207_008789 [Rhodosporidiobolus poonsookiae]